MSNIDFLHKAGGGSDDGGKKTDEKKQKITWSRPMVDDVVQKTNTQSAPSKQGGKFGFFSKLFGKQAVSRKKAPLKSPVAVNTPPSPPDQSKKQTVGNKKDFSPEDLSFYNPDILETNLIKDEIISFFDWKKNLILLCCFIFLSLATIGVAYFWLDSWSKRKEAENLSFVDGFTKLQNETKSMEKESADAIFFKKRLSLVKTLLDKHVYWTNFFDFLEKNTVEDVYYTGGFKGSRSERYSMSAKTSSFNVVAEQVKALRKNNTILSVDVNSGSLGSSDKNSDGEVDFTLNFTIDPSVFIK